MSAARKHNNESDPDIAHVLSLVDGQVVRRRFRWEPGARDRIPNMSPPVTVQSYADATSRIVWVGQLYGSIARNAPDTVERRRLLEQAHFALPSRDFRRIARERSESALIAPIAQQLDERSHLVATHLASLDSPAERFPVVGGAATRLILAFLETVNLLQPYVVDEREWVPHAALWVYEDEITRRVKWDDRGDGFISVRAAIAILNDRAFVSDGEAPSLQVFGKYLDSPGNPIRHMKRRAAGGGRGNRRVLASDVEAHAADVLARKRPR